MKYIVLTNTAAPKHERTPDIIVLSQHDSEKDAEQDIKDDMDLFGTKASDYKIVIW